VSGPGRGRGPLPFARAGLLAVAAAAIASCSTARADVAPGGAALAPGDHEFTLRHGGRARHYHVHVPPAARDGARLPVMLAFHGGGGEAAGFKRYAGLDDVSDRHGFLAVYPDGTGPLRNRLLTWNAGGCCGRAMEQDVDDVAFAIAVLDDVARRTSVDAERVYATGHSNGAMMAYRLAAERADRIAAIVPVGGAMSLDGPFSPSLPVAVLHIHSVDDPRALYGGGLGPPFPMTNQRVPHRPVEEALASWIARNGCAAAPDTLARRSGRTGARDAGHTAVLLAWTRCRSGFEVAHWKLTGAGHSWPGNERAEVRESVIGPATTVVDAAVEAWTFATRFRRTVRSAR